MRLHMAPASLCWAGHLVSKSMGWAQRLVIATPNAKTASCLWVKETYYLVSSPHRHTLIHIHHITKPTIWCLASVHIHTYSHIHHITKLANAILFEGTDGSL